MLVELAIGEEAPSEQLGGTSDSSLGTVSELAALLEQPEVHHRLYLLEQMAWRIAIGSAPRITAPRARLEWESFVSSMESGSYLVESTCSGISSASRIGVASIGTPRSEQESHVIRVEREALTAEELEQLPVGSVVRPVRGEHLLGPLDASVIMEEDATAEADRCRKLPELAT